MFKIFAWYAIPRALYVGISFVFSLTHSHYLIVWFAENISTWNWQFFTCTHALATIFMIAYLMPHYLNFHHINLFNNMECKQFTDIFFHFSCLQFSIVIATILRENKKKPKTFDYLHGSKCRKLTIYISHMNAVKTELLAKRRERTNEQQKNYA